MALPPFDDALLNRLLDAIEHDVLPLTEAGVAAGNKVFGAALLDKATLGTVLTWSGFDNFFYLFSHADSRDAFAIPHDLRILREVFGTEHYRRENAFWSGHAIRELVRDPAAQERIEALEARYATLSARYQASKADNAIPLR